MLQELETFIAKMQQDLENNAVSNTSSETNNAKELTFTKYTNENHNLSKNSTNKKCKNKNKKKK